MALGWVIPPAPWHFLKEVAPCSECEERGGKGRGEEERGGKWRGGEERGGKWRGGEERGGKGKGNVMSSVVLEDAVL